MPHHILTLDSMNKLDEGKAQAAFAQHLQRAARDCLDRPFDAKQRDVVMKVSIVPVREDDGSCVKVKAQVFVSSKVPVHRTKLYELGLKATGGLVFSEDSPESVDQGTLFDGDDDE